MGPGRTATTAIAATAALAVLTGTGPASAETRTTHDARHDVVRMSDDTSSGPGQLVPHQRSGDVVSMRATYGHRRVRVTLTYAVLHRPARDDQQAVHVVSVRTDTGRRADLSLLTSRSKPQGQRFWERDGDLSTCRGLHSRVDYRHDRVRFSIPRRCLGNPTWVRVGGGGGVLVGQTLYADDVSRNGAVGHDVAFGPRIHRG